MGMLLVILLIQLAVIVVVLIGMWKVFVKAGQPGWAAIIPIYNMFVLITKVAIRPWWFIFALLAMFIPFVGGLVVMAMMVIISLDVARNFGRTPLFGVGLAFLPFIFYLVLGFGKDTFNPQPKQFLPQLT